MARVEELNGKRFDVAIIGGGLGGLQCGYILSKKGLEVCILEQNNLLGGCLQSFVRRAGSTGKMSDNGNMANIAEFDTGLHYVGGLDEGQSLNTLFKYFNLMDLPWQKMDANGFDEVVINGKSYMFANGYDQTPVATEDYHIPIKSIGNSTTTPKDLTCNEDVKITIYVLAESVAARLRENNFRCSVVEISVRDTELYSFTRQKKLKLHTDITTEIAEAAYELFLKSYNFDRQKPIRSIGVRGSSLVPSYTAEQTSLFVDPLKREKMHLMDQAVDSIRNRFGSFSIQRGILLKDKVLSNIDAKEDHTIHPKGYFQDGDKTGLNQYLKGRKV